MDNVDILRNFPIYGNKETLFNLLHQYDAYKDTIDKPGDIVIVGNNILLPLISFANFTETQTMGDRTRLVYGFDSFNPSSIFETKKEYESIKEHSFGIYNKDRFAIWKDRIIYSNNGISGFKKFLNKNIGLKISLLYCVNIKKEEKYIEKFTKPYLIKNTNLISSYAK